MVLCQSTVGEVKAVACKALRLDPQLHELLDYTSFRLPQVRAHEGAGRERAGRVHAHTCASFGRAAS